MTKLLLVLVIVAAVIAIAYSDEIQEEWQAYKLKYHKLYRDNDELRFQNFLQNRNKIAEHNALYDVGKVSFTMGLNQFSDMDELEYQKTMTNGLKYVQENLNDDNATLFISTADLTASKSVDWRTKGAVTGVKNQGQCGSCWAFSAAGCLEGQHFRKTKKLIPLSEQNLVDCSTANGGCNGGNMNNAYNYIRANGGINSGQTYPYRAVQGSCRFDRSKIAATVRGYANISPGNEQKLMQAVDTIGPISVGIDASRSSFASYRSGVYNDARCTKNLNHGVVIVGYGTEANGGDYWLVKNSWGTGWGDRGYIKMARNRNNQCGIANMASYPHV